MLKYQRITNLILQLAFALVIAVTFLPDTATAALPEKRLCADENCKGIIAMGKGLVKYHAGDKHMVSFNPNSIIRIKSKSADGSDNLLGIEVNGREGYAPKNFIREEKVLVPSKKLVLVDLTKLKEAQASVPNASDASTIAESTAKQPLDNSVAAEVNIVKPDISATATVINGEGIKVDGTVIPTFDNVEMDKVQNGNSDEFRPKDEIESIQQTPEENKISMKDMVNDNSEDGEIGDYDDDDGGYDVFDENIEAKQVIPLPSSSNSSEKDTAGQDKNEMDNNETNLNEGNLIKDNKMDAQNQNVNSTRSLENESNNATADPIEAPFVSKESNEEPNLTQNNLNPIPKMKQIMETPEDTDNNSLNTTETQLGVDNIKDESHESVNNDIKSFSSATVPDSNEVKSEEVLNNQTTTGGTNENVEVESTILSGETREENIEVTTSQPAVETFTEISAPASVTNAEYYENNVSNQNIDNGSSNETIQTEKLSNEIPVEDTNTLEDSKETENEQPPAATDTNININPNQDSEIQLQQNMEVPTEEANKQPEDSLSSVTADTPSDSVVVQIQPQESQETIESSTEYNNLQYNPYAYAEVSNTPLPPQTTTDSKEHYIYESYTNEPFTTEQETEVTTPMPVNNNNDYIQHSPYEKIINNEPEQPINTQINSNYQTEDPLAVTPPELVPVVDPIKKDNKGLFATIMDTVNNILPNSKKHHNELDHEVDDQLDRILYPDMNVKHSISKDEKLYCEKLDSNNCPHASSIEAHSSGSCQCSIKDFITSEFTIETFLQAFASKVLEISELIAFLAIVAAASLFFIFGYYCFCNSSSEGALLSKLNQLESSLLATHKENAILKHNLMATRHKLASIEDNSFGSNDMVVSLRKELEEELLEKAGLQEQIVALQKELENAADAGIELNKIVSELLSNQTGDESIISSVEELQKQLNEQQNTILEINASLAEKSRENSELQLIIAEQNTRYETKLSDLQQDNDELETEKSNLQTRLEEIRTDFDREITAALESKNFEIKRLQNEIIDLNDKIESEHTKWQTSMAKIEALEECLKNLKKDPNLNITQVINVANVKAELLDAQKKLKGLKERWELEQDARKLAEGQLQSATTEIEKIKQDFNQTEKDKLEAQTRLEVLSNYFKEKENQLQKELSLKETMWLKQQGETTTTVDRLTAMQEEIQSLKSQNDALRAEIEAQDAAHKAQTGTLENRAHETWLAARQSDRRYEEARAEATALRRKLTVLAGSTANDVNKQVTGPPAVLGDDLANAPSPIHMESPGSPMLNRMPPPPFLPPPFMGPPPPFMGLPPPPPFVPPGEMRPAPLGRIMSPPPSHRSGHVDYDDYLDYEGNTSWHRHHTYSPPPRTYRSLSPTDSRYNYGTERDLISTYDTETDFSPPPSPRETRRRGPGGGYGSENEDSKLRHQYNNSKKNPTVNKVPESSGSDKSYNSSSKKGNRSKSSGGKFLV